MKTITKKGYSTISTPYKISAVIVAICLSAQIAFNLSSNFKQLLLIIPVFILLLFLFYYEYFNTKKEISIQQQAKIHGIHKCWFICFFIILAGQIFYWLAFFPGGFNLDALNQWYQIHGIYPVNNWHSPIVTFGYWLITRISDSLASCIFIQIVLFSIAAALLISELYKQYISLTMAVICSILIAFNPAIGRTNICIYKDVPFTILAVLLWTILLKILASKGKYLNSMKFSAILALLLSGLILVRHNGVLLVFGVLLCLVRFYKRQRKHLVAVILATTGVVFLIEGPIYHALNVQPHANVTGESVGVPMAIMANALVEDPEHMPGDAMEFLHSIEPDDEVWKDTYVVGEWDSCKWVLGQGASEGMLLADADILEIFRLAAKTAVVCPQATYESFHENTKIAWQIVGPCNWLPYVFQEENPYGITYHSVTLLTKAEGAFFSFFSKGPFCIYHWNTGLIIAILMLLALRSTKHNETSKAILVIPLIVYNVGTSLIIAGPNYRYFYVNAVLFIPVALYLFCVPKKETHAMNITAF